MCGLSDYPALLAGPLPAVGAERGAAAFAAARFAPAVRAEGEPTAIATGHTQLTVHAGAGSAHQLTAPASYSKC
jgi:hypothetical protein